MFLCILSKHQNIINMAEYPRKSQKYIIHLSLKYFRCTEDPKQQLIKTKLFKGYNKDGQQPGIFSKWDLPEPAVGIKIVAPDNCANAVSTLGIGCTSCKTLSLRGFRSVQIRTAPVSLGTTTIFYLQHQKRFPP